MIWAIGDIHGMIDPLRRLISEIRLLEEKDDPVERIIFIGDYIDHGPSSKQVMDLVRRLDFETVLLAGNHEDMALRFIKQDQGYFENFGNSWFGNGAADTYLSLFGDRGRMEKAREILRAGGGRASYQGLEIPKVYERFLSSLKYSHLERLEIKGREVAVNFFHALPDSGAPISAQKAPTRKALEARLASIALERRPELSAKGAKRELLLESRRLLVSSFIWGRNYNFERGYEGEVVVHGHTPTLAYPGYYPSLPRALSEYWPQFMEYLPQALAPFLFSLCPGARYEMASPLRLRDLLLKLGASPKWLGAAVQSLAYRTSGENGVEAINIDTGSVLGGGLTALGLSKKYLDNGLLMSLVYPNDGDQRRKKEKVIKRVIMIDRLGGKTP